MDWRTTLALLALAAPALAADGAAVLSPGDGARGDLAAGETDRITFEGVAGVRLTADLRADFPPVLALLGPGGTPVDAGKALRAAANRARIRSLVLPASGKYTIVIQSAGAAGGSYGLGTRAGNPRPVRAVATGPAGVGTAVPLGDLPGGAAVRLRVRGGVLVGLDGPGVALDLPAGARGTAVLPATGAWSARVVPEGTRPVAVVARARLAPPSPVLREVLDAPAAGGNPGDRVAGAVLVRFREGSDDGAFDDRHGCSTGGGIRGTGFTRVDLPDGVEVEDFLAEISLDGDVVEGEPILVGETPEGEQSNVPFTASDAAAADVAVQEAFAAVGAGPALALADGTGVVVAVLDTGVLPGHPFLAGRLLPGIDLVDGDLDPTDAPNGIDDDGDGVTDEGVGHGTFVAGLIAGLAPGARILPVRVLDGDARGTSDRVAEGIVRAVDAGARVVNLSLGIRRSASVIQDALGYAFQRDVLVVASAGNAGLENDVAFPGSLSGVLTVTAVGAGGERAGFSNVSSKVDLAAPGVQVLGPFGPDGYALWSGTSFAAPFASGGAALVLSRHPAMRPGDAGKVLTDTATPLDGVDPTWAGVMGAGLVNLAEAVAR